MGTFMSTTVDRFIGKKQAIVLILGLEHAGKSTLMKYLYNTLEANIDDQMDLISGNDHMFQVISRKYKDRCFVFAAIDIILRHGRRHQGRLNVIRQYLQNLDALVWILDANDEKRVETAQQEFHFILSEMEKCSNQYVRNKCSILILGNVRHRISSMAVDEISGKMQFLRDIPISEALFYELRYVTLLKYLPAEIFEIVVDYLQCCKAIGPSKRIEPVHLADLTCIPLQNETQIVQNICDYLPNVAYNNHDNDAVSTAQYQTLLCCVKTGEGINEAMEWIYNAVFNQHTL